MSSMMRIPLSIFMSLLFTLQLSIASKRVVPRFSSCNCESIPVDDMMTSAVIVS